MDYKEKNSLYFSLVLSSPIPATLGIFCMKKTEVRVNFCGNERWKENRQRGEKSNFQSRILNLKALKKNGCPILQIYVYDHAMEYHQFRVPVVNFYFHLCVCYIHFFIYYQYANSFKLGNYRFGKVELFLILTVCITY